MRALSHNKPPAATEIWSRALNDNGDLIPTVVVNDPDNPGRCLTQFSDDEPATGGTNMQYHCEGFQEFRVRVNVPPPGTQQEGPSLDLQPAGIDPFKIPLSVRRAYRGSIWTRRAAVPFGPRPGQPSNICAMDYLESYGPSDRATMHAAYFGQAKYKHFPFGPLIDPGYHGDYPAVDFRTDPDYYARIMQEATNKGGIAVLFMSPDNWSHEDCETILTPLFQRPAFQRVVTEIVPYGWEPGGYNISNADWVRRLTWGRTCFPSARIGIHMPTDFDAPIGGNDGAPVGTMTKQEAWTNVYNAGARFFLRQVSGYLNSGPTLTPEFAANFTADLSWFVRHFAEWGLVDFDVVAGEYAAYVDYWNDYPEDVAVAIGDLAMTVPGVMGFFDGGTA